MTDGAKHQLTNRRTDQVIGKLYYYVIRFLSLKKYSLHFKKLGEKLSLLVKAVPGVVVLNQRVGYRK